MAELPKKWSDFVSERRHVENYHDFEKLAQVIQHGLQRFIVKNIQGTVHKPPTYMVFRTHHAFFPTNVRGEGCITSLRTSAWEAINVQAWLEFIYQITEQCPR